MTPEVTQAIDEVRLMFPTCPVQVEPDPHGGAFVTVSNVPLGSKYNPDTSWFGFHITFQYPRSDVYPHFIDGAVIRKDGRGHGAGITGQQWQGKSAFQISRRSNRLDPAIDTAATKLAKVMMWLDQQ